MGRLNGALLHRLERVEQLVPVVVAPPPAEVDEVAAFWQSVYDVAPPALWMYIMAVEAEAQTAKSPSPGGAALRETARNCDDWLKQHHPALENALAGLHYAYRSGAVDRLRRVQGEVLKYSYWRLGWAFARDRQPETGAVHYNGVVQAQAAEALLAMSHRAAHDAWLEPERFVDQWRNFVVVNLDPDVLERAGLFRAELDFLNEED